MKVLSNPSSGALGTIVAYVSPFGQIYRSRGRLKNTWSAGRDFMRGVFGHHSQVYSRGLTQAQRDRWCYAGSQVMSHPRLGSGPLSGQQLHERLNCVLSRVGRPSVAEPTAPVVFGPSPVGELVIETGEDGARLFVRVNGPLEEDIMVFGQAPCSAGRSKRRNVSYLGRLGPVVDGLGEITELYKARFGEPQPGTKVFIVTCQQKDGWEGPRHVTSEIVPGWPAKHAKQAKGELSELKELTGLNGVGAAGGETLGARAASAGENSSKRLMHKGSTRGAEGTGPLPDGQAGGGAEPGDGGRKGTGGG